jgi:hypothetical protein
MDATTVIRIDAVNPNQYGCCNTNQNRCIDKTFKMTHKLQHAVNLGQTIVKIHALAPKNKKMPTRRATQCQNPGNGPYTTKGFQSWAQTIVTIL